MDKKKVISFLLLRPAFTMRNLTSIGLVAIFFAIYVLAGGKVSLMPAVPRGQGFGSLEKENPAAMRSVDPARTPEAAVKEERYSGADAAPRGVASDAASFKAVPEAKANSESSEGSSSSGKPSFEERLKNIQVRKNRSGQ